MQSLLTYAGFASATPAESMSAADGITPDDRGGGGGRDLTATTIQTGVNEGGESYRDHHGGAANSSGSVTPTSLTCDGGSSAATATSLSSSAGTTSSSLPDAGQQMAMNLPLPLSSATGGTTTAPRREDTAPPQPSSVAVVSSQRPSQFMGTSSRLPFGNEVLPAVAATSEGADSTLRKNRPLSTSGRIETGDRFPICLTASNLRWIAGSTFSVDVDAADLAKQGPNDVVGPHVPSRCAKRVLGFELPGVALPRGISPALGAIMNKILTHFNGDPSVLPSSPTKADAYEVPPLPPMTFCLEVSFYRSVADGVQQVQEARGASTQPSPSASGVLDDAAASPRSQPTMPFPHSPIEIYADVLAHPGRAGNLVDHKERGASFRLQSLVTRLGCARVTRPVPSLTTQLLRDERIAAAMTTKLVVSKSTTGIVGKRATTFASVQAGIERSALRNVVVVARIFDVLRGDCFRVQLLSPTAFIDNDDDDDAAQPKRAPLNNSEQEAGHRRRLEREVATVLRQGNVLTVRTACVESPPLSRDGGFESFSASRQFVGCVVGLVLHAHRFSDKTVASNSQMDTVEQLDHWEGCPFLLQGRRDDGEVHSSFCSRTAASVIHSLCDGDSSDMVRFSTSSLEAQLLLSGTAKLRAPASFTTPRGATFTQLLRVIDTFGDGSAASETSLLGLTLVRPLDLCLGSAAVVGEGSARLRDLQLGTTADEETGGWSKHRGAVTTSPVPPATLSASVRLLQQSALFRVWSRFLFLGDCLKSVTAPARHQFTPLRMRTTRRNLVEHCAQQCEAFWKFRPPSRASAGNAEEINPANQDRDSRIYFGGPFLAGYILKVEPITGDSTVTVVSDQRGADPHAVVSTEYIRVQVVLTLPHGYSDTAVASGLVGHIVAHPPPPDASNAMPYEEVDVTLSFQPSVRAAAPPRAPQRTPLDRKKGSAGHSDELLRSVGESDTALGTKSITDDDDNEADDDGDDDAALVAAMGSATPYYGLYDISYCLTRYASRAAFEDHQSHGTHRPKRFDAFTGVPLILAIADRATQEACYVLDVQVAREGASFCASTELEVGGGAAVVRQQFVYDLHRTGRKEHHHHNRGGIDATSPTEFDSDTGGVSLVSDLLEALADGDGDGDHAGGGGGAAAADGVLKGKGSSLRQKSASAHAYDASLGSPASGHQSSSSLEKVYHCVTDVLVPRYRLEGDLRDHQFGSDRWSGGPTPHDDIVMRDVLIVPYGTAAHARRLALLGHVVVVDRRERVALRFDPTCGREPCLPSGTPSESLTWVRAADMLNKFHAAPPQPVVTSSSSSVVNLSDRILISALDFITTTSSTRGIGGNEEDVRLAHLVPPPPSALEDYQQPHHRAAAAVLADGSAASGCGGLSTVARIQLLERASRRSGRRHKALSGDDATIGSCVVCLSRHAEIAVGSLCALDWFFAQRSANGAVLLSLSANGSRRDDGRQPAAAAAASTESPLLPMVPPPMFAAISSHGGHLTPRIVPASLQPQLTMKFTERSASSSSSSSTPAGLPLASLALFPRMLFPCHVTHHLKITHGDVAVGKATFDGEVIPTGMAQPDYAFVQLELPRLPCLWRCDLDRLPLSLRGYSASDLQRDLLRVGREEEEAEGGDMPSPMNVTTTSFFSKMIAQSLAAASGGGSCPPGRATSLPEEPRGHDGNGPPSSSRDRRAASADNGFPASAPPMGKPKRKAERIDSRMASSSRLIADAAALANFFSVLFTVLPRKWDTFQAPPSGGRGHTGDLGSGGGGPLHKFRDNFEIQVTDFHAMGILTRLPVHNPGATIDDTERRGVDDSAIIGPFVFRTQASMPATLFSTDVKFPEPLPLPLIARVIGTLSRETLTSTTASDDAFGTQYHRRSHRSVAPTSEPKENDTHSVGGGGPAASFSPAIANDYEGRVMGEAGLGHMRGDEPYVAYDFDDYGGVDPTQPPPPSGSNSRQRSDPAAAVAPSDGQGMVDAANGASRWQGRSPLPVTVVGEGLLRHDGRHVLLQPIPVRLSKRLGTLYKMVSYGQIPRDAIFAHRCMSVRRGRDVAEYFRCLLSRAPTGGSVVCDGDGSVAVRHAPADGLLQLYTNAHEALYLFFLARRTLRSTLAHTWDVFQHTTTAANDEEEICLFAQLMRLARGIFAFIASRCQLPCVIKSRSFLANRPAAEGAPVEAARQMEGEEHHNATAIRSDDDLADDGSDSAFPREGRQAVAVMRAFEAENVSDDPRAQFEAASGLVDLRGTVQGRLRSVELCVFWHMQRRMLVLHPVLDNGKLGAELCLGDGTQS